MKSKFARIIDVCIAIVDKYFQFCQISATKD